MLILLFGLIVNFLQANVESQILNQTKTYINEIQKKNNTSEHVWALITIYQASCNHSNSVQRLVENSSVFLPKQLLSTLDCNDDIPGKEFIKILHNYDLHGFLIYLLAFHRNSIDYDELETYILNVASLSFPDNYTQLIKKISNKESVSTQDIPEEHRQLILFAIYYSYSDYLYPPIKDQEFLLQRFYGSNDWESSIISSLELSNIAFFLFNSDRLSEFSKLHSYVMSDSYFPNSDFRIRHARALAWTNSKVGRYDQDLEVQRHIIEPLSTYFQLTDGLHESLMAQGVALYALGKYSTAKDIFEDLYDNSHTKINRAKIINNLSASYERLGEKNKFIRYLLDAFKEANEENDYKFGMTILGNLYYHYLDIGDHKSALSYLELSKDIAIKINDIQQVGRFYAIRGTYYWKIDNDLERGLEQFRMATSIFNPEVDFNNFLRSHQEMVKILIELDSLKQAEEILTYTANIASKRSNKNAFIESNIGLMEIALHKNDLKSAKNIQSTIALYSLEHLGFDELVKYNTLNAYLQFNTGDERFALTNLKPVIEQVLERVRNSTESQTGFWVQQEEYIHAFNTYLEMLIAMDNDYEAIQLLDEIKTINDAVLYNSPILRANKLSEEDLANDKILNAQIITLREAFLFETDENTRFKIKNQIDQVSAEREDILNKIRISDKRNKLPIWLIQQRVKSDEQIIHFTEVGNALYVSYISNRSVRLEKFDLDAASRELFKKVADEIASSNTNLKHLYEISSFLRIKDVIDVQKKKIIVIPDNYFYRIPLDIFPLVDPDNPYSYGSTTYLLEKYNIEYFASLKEYHTDTKSRKDKLFMDFSAFAISDFKNFEESYLPTLPFATKEVNNISKILDAFPKQKIYLDAEATKSAFLSHVSNSKILHIATHSEVSEQDPLFSTIYLNKSDSVTGSNALYAYELFKQQLNNELIMLNSCSSGSGNYIQGSGIMGITRALRYAGTKSMALNLWAVNDKVASEFASVFYRSLNSGKSKSESIRDAKLFLLENGNANPHFWGAFILTGDPSPVIANHDRENYLYSSLLLLVGILGVFMRKSFSFKTM
jgi:CHAT domain-containing protein/tetratricopeptide (TPR) repeat protein